MLDTIKTFLYMWVFRLYVCVLCVPGAIGGQKIVSDAIKLEL